MANETTQMSRSRCSSTEIIAPLQGHYPGAYQPADHHGAALSLEKDHCVRVESASTDSTGSAETVSSGSQTNVHDSKTSPAEPVSPARTTSEPYVFPEVPDRCLPIRNICAAGLLGTLCFAIAALVVGAYLIKLGAQPPPGWLEGTGAWVGYDFAAWTRPGHDWYIAGRWPFISSNAASVLLPLVVSYGITALLDCTSRIHATSLRWALYDEGRLVFHSNPRLFSAARKHWPNKWYINVLGLFAIIFAYGASSLLFAQIHILGWMDADYNLLPDKPYYGPRYAIDVNGWALFVLGLAMLLQSALAAWSLFDRPRLIRTWSTHVMKTVSIYSLDQALLLSPASTRCGTLSSSKERQDHHNITVREHSQTAVQRSNAKQPSARTIVASVRYLTLILWLLFGLSVLCIIIIAFLARYLTVGNSTSRSYVSEYTDGGATLSGYWGGFGQVSFPVSEAPTWDQNRDWLAVIIQTCLLVPLTLALHYTEVLVDVLRDEAAWREAMAGKMEEGRLSNRLLGRITHAVRSRMPTWMEGHLPRWPGVVLFLVKGLAQWVFSCLIRVGYYAYIQLLPLVALSVILLVVAAGAEVLSRHHPRGSLRSTYGNLALCHGG